MPLQVFNLPKSSQEAPGAEKQLGSCPLCVLGRPNAVPFLCPPVSPAWVHGTNPALQLRGKTRSV